MCIRDRVSREPKKDKPQKEEGPKETRGLSPAVQAGDRVKISPRAKKIAKDLKVDYNLVQGTGPDGAITEEDIRRFVEGTKAKVSPTAAIVAEQLGVDILNIEKETRIMKAAVSYTHLDVYKRQM